MYRVFMHTHGTGELHHTEILCTLGTQRTARSIPILASDAFCITIEHLLSGHLCTKASILFTIFSLYFSLSSHWLFTGCAELLLQHIQYFAFLMGTNSRNTHKPLFLYVLKKPLLYINNNIVTIQCMKSDVIGSVSRSKREGAV